ncbi:MAG: hypothetical protein ABL999_11355 [Pyrinomonadaceae bacterium]
MAAVLTNETLKDEIAVSVAQIDENSNQKWAGRYCGGRLSGGYFY